MEAIHRNMHLLRKQKIIMSRFRVRNVGYMIVSVLFLALAAFVSFLRSVREIR